MSVDPITRASSGPRFTPSPTDGHALRKRRTRSGPRGRDFSAALFDARGQMVSRAIQPGHLGSMPS